MKLQIRQGCILCGLYPLLILYFIYFKDFNVNVSLFEGRLMEVNFHQIPDNIYNISESA